MVSIAPQAGPRVKGVSFRSVVRAVETLHGPDVLAACMTQVSTELADAFRYGTVLASSWYPIAKYRELLGAILKKVPVGDRCMFELGRQCAQQDMTGIYKVGFKLLSPQAVIRLAARLYSNYYDTGNCQIVESKSGYAHARWSGCVGFNRNLWQEVFGATEMFMELAGAKHIRSRVVAGGDDDDEFAEFSGHWT